jgi:hypothetical protein
MQDSEDALRLCLAARDEYSSDLDDADPPTVALKAYVKYKTRITRRMRHLIVGRTRLLGTI